MADDVTTSAGIIATDDVSGGGTPIHAQLVKLAYSADGDRTHATVDAGGVLVNLGTNNNVAVDTALPAGTNNIGDVDVASIAAGDNNIGNVDIVTVPADPFGANADAASATGSVSAKLRFIAGTGIPVTALPASTNTIEVVGDAAHDAVAAGNPVLTGGFADADGDTTAVAGGDVARLLVDLMGRQWVRPIAPTTTITAASSALTTVTTAYTAGDQLGAIRTAASAARVSGGTGIIRQIKVHDEADITSLVTVFIYRSTVTLAGDNAAWSVSDADTRNLIWRGQIAMTDEGNQRVGFANPYCAFDCTAADLFIAVRTDTAHTFFANATDLPITLWIVQD
jgi:hypothetical protein